MTRLLIDASNLKAGGGLQVAASLLEEFALLKGAAPDTFSWAKSIHVVISRAVAKQLDQAVMEVLDCEVVDTGIRDFFRPRAGKVYDVVFAVFGPAYKRRNAGVLIQGYADVTSVYPQSQAGAVGSFARLKLAVRAALSRRIARASDLLVVETEAFRSRCAAALGMEADRIFVIPNALNRIFLEPSRWAPLSHHIEKQDSVSYLCHVGRSYPHKNLDFLGAVGRECRSRGREVRFVLTLRPEEWARLSPLTRSFSVNVGELSIHQVPALYKACDAAIFPSLLESFSAMPLEAMAMQVPLVAGNHDFVSTVCGDVPFYFEPGSVKSCADAIADALGQSPNQMLRRKRGFRMVQDLPTASSRAMQVLDLLSSIPRAERAL